MPKQVETGKFQGFQEQDSYHWQEDADMALSLPPQAYLTEASPQSSGGHFYDPWGYCNYKRFHEEPKPQRKHQYQDLSSE